MLIWENYLVVKFLTTFENKIFLTLSLIIQVAFKVEPLNQNQEEKLMIATQHPYTTIKNILNLKPAEKEQNTRDISVRKTREVSRDFDSFADKCKTHHLK